MSETTPLAALPSRAKPLSRVDLLDVLFHAGLMGLCPPFFYAVEPDTDLLDGLFEGPNQLETGHYVIIKRRAQA